MTLKEYFASLSGKTAAVIGLGVSNRPLLSLLLRSGVRVIGCDRKERDAFRAEEYEALGAELHLGADYLKELHADVIFRSPGVRPDTPELLAAAERGAVITNEMETFFSVCPCRIIGVTGSDGKTTTTTILSELLRAAGKRVWLGGNIGHPLLADADRMQPEDIAVVELSSFQLQDMKHSPDVAVVTNLAPNHLDWHRDMAEYIEAKKNIFLHQKPSGLLILNADNEASRPLAQQARGEVRYFSRQREVENGAFLSGGTIFAAADGRRLPIAEENRIRLPGMHNIENYMAAFCALRGFVEPHIMDEVARSFSGVEHRCEPVRELRGVKWFNDSIASTPTRTVAGLHSFSQRVILLAGGYDKHIPFDALGQEIVSHVKTLILCGATADAIERSVVSCEAYRTGTERPQIIRCRTLAESVQTADRIAEAGDIVTLSPACAAFDQFKDFAERGNTFKALVAAL